MLFPELNKLDKKRKTLFLELNKLSGQRLIRWRRVSLQITKKAPATPKGALRFRLMLIALCKRYVINYRLNF